MALRTSEAVNIPKPHTLYKRDTGLTRYRLFLTSIYVSPLAGCAGGRFLRVSEDGNDITFKLSADQAKHLAGLLLAKPRRVKR